MILKNRETAARQLAVCLGRYRGQQPLVLALPRGAVPMARIIADALQGDLSLVLASKLVMPGYEEYAIGAVSEGGFFYKNPEVDTFAIPEWVFQDAMNRQLALIAERRRKYRLDERPYSAGGRITILVDDGIATGSTVLAAWQELRAQKPAKLIVAAPVAPPVTAQRIRSLVDELILLDQPDNFYAVAQFYEDFSEVSDEEVMQILWGESADCRKSHSASSHPTI